MDADPRLQDCAQLLRCTRPAAQHSSVCVASSTTVAGRLAGAITSGLRQHNACQSTWKSAPQTADVQPFGPAQRWSSVYAAWGCGPSVCSVVHAAVYVMAVTVAVVPGVLSDRRHGFDRSVTAPRSSPVTGRHHRWRRKIDDLRHRCCVSTFTVTRR